MKLEEMLRLPTIMYIDQEISVIRELMGMPIDYLVANKEIFSTLIFNLETSHTGGGYFELTRENESIFFEFADWLETVNRHFAAPVVVDACIDNFRISYDDLVKAYGPARPVAAAPDLALNPDAPKNVD
ncbi:MAG: hypothetical protein FWC42_11260 [Proteobacteria bacterium]|nr:hypothetical protein [Pseudomonadota bacterium]